MVFGVPCSIGINLRMDRKGYGSVEEFQGVALEKMMMLRDLPKEEVHLATGNVVWENRGLHRIWVKD